MTKIQKTKLPWNEMNRTQAMISLNMFENSRIEWPYTFPYLRDVFKLKSNSTQLSQLLKIWNFNFTADWQKDYTEILSCKSISIKFEQNFRMGKNKP